MLSFVSFWSPISHILAGRFDRLFAPDVVDESVRVEAIKVGLFLTVSLRDCGFARGL